MAKTILRSHPHCVFNIKAHLVLVVAYRRKVITKEIMDDLEKHVRRVCDLSDVNVLEFSGEPDHVHILLELHPNIMRSEERRVGKERSSMCWTDRYIMNIVMT